MSITDLPPAASAVADAKTKLISQISENSNIKNKAKDKANKTSKGLDQVDVGMQEVYKSLTMLADEVLAKLEEILAEDLPDGIRNLKPENHTPEATADRIITGVSALFPVYAAQNPQLEGEELVDSFMKTIRGGIEDGYKQAENILGDIGAYEIEGVESGIEETKKIVEEKLEDLRNKLLIAVGVKTEEEEAEPAEEGSEVATPSNIGLDQESEGSPVKVGLGETVA